jgi:hypothetical protein
VLSYLIDRRSIDQDAQLAGFGLPDRRPAAVEPAVALSSTRGPGAAMTPQGEWAALDAT